MENLIELINECRKQLRTKRVCRVSSNDVMVGMVNVGNGYQVEVTINDVKVDCRRAVCHSRDAELARTVAEALNKARVPTDMPMFRKWRWMKV